LLPKNCWKTPKTRLISISKID